MNKVKERTSMRLNYEMGMLWCWTRMAGGVYKYADGGRAIGERVINELERCKDTIAF